jgi:hypothetical protein
VKAAAFEHLSKGDRGLVWGLVRQYTASRARPIKDSPGVVNRNMRNHEARRYRRIRAELRKLLGPGFPSLIRPFAVGRVFERSGLQTR